MLPTATADRLLIADNLSDNVVLETKVRKSREVVQLRPEQKRPLHPQHQYPYTVVANKAGNQSLGQFVEFVPQLQN